MQAQAAGGGTSPLQNPKVQIGVIAGGAIALIAVIVMLIMNGNTAAPAPTPQMGDDAGVSATAGTPGGPTPGGVAPALNPGGVPGGAPANMPGGAPPTGMAMPMAASPAPGGAPGAAAEGAAPKKGPGVPVRNNPFAENKELKDVLDNIPAIAGPPEVTAQEHRIYQDELYKPKPPVQVDDQDDREGPPIPTMRVAGVVYGKQVSATLQIGEQYMQVTPGQMIPASNPLYRVDRIEQETVHLSRRWEMGTRKGVQRIEVGLAARAASPGAGGYGAPGAPGGYPGAGYPGAGAPLF
jgi:hypothetical protein